MDIQPYRNHPNILAPHYRAFRVDERLLLTGHSHQAWPDCGLAGQIRAWQDAVEWVDAKWARAAEKAERVQGGFRTLLQDTQGLIALGQNTFELVLRFISALPLRQRPRLVTSANEFHTLRRLLDRLAEEGVEIVKIPSQPFDTFMERLAQAVTDKTAAVLSSHVFFDSGIMAGNFAEVARRCAEMGCELLIDAYHSLNVAPFTVAEHKLENAYIVGGGYKYCQLGEGNCFLRLPADCTLRPIATGWFSEFDLIAAAPSELTHYSEPTRYGAGAARFAGSTYDPTSHYRAAEVFDFFQRQMLTAARLRHISQHQIALLCREFERLDLNPVLIRLDSDVDTARRAGFLALYTPRAEWFHARLKALDVLTDFRGERLRFGPAPYLSDRQLTDAMLALRDVAAKAL